MISKICSCNQFLATKFRSVQRFSNDQEIPSALWFLNLVMDGPPKSTGYGINFIITYLRTWPQPNKMWCYDCPPLARLRQFSSDDMGRWTRCEISIILQWHLAIDLFGYKWWYKWKFTWWLDTLDMTTPLIDLWEKHNDPLTWITKDIGF